MEWGLGLRAGAVTAFALAVTTAAHVFGGGHLELAPPLVAGVLLLPLVIVALRRGFRPASTAGALGALQVAMHAALQVASNPMPAVTVTGGHHPLLHATGGGPAAAQAAVHVGHTAAMNHGLDLRMVVAHLVATTVLTRCLTGSERRIVAAAKMVLRVLAPRLPVPVDVSATGAVRRSWTVRRLRTQHLRETCAARGPPLPTL